MRLSAFFLMGLCALAWSTLGAPKAAHASDDSGVASSEPAPPPQTGGGQNGQDCDDHGQQGAARQHHCDLTRFAQFNVVCFYKRHEHKEPGQGQGQGQGQDRDDDKDVCKASSVFSKRITADGGEVMDRSPEPGEGDSAQLPLLEVECGHDSKFNDHARRWTDLLSTRIQGLSGPHPAIYLPRGTLHEGPHVADSYLEVESGIPGNPNRMYGKCHIWTGRP